MSPHKKEREYALNWQQMASFNVRGEEPDDLPQQRGTRELKQSLRERSLVEKSTKKHIIFQLGDSGFTEEDEE